MTTQTYQIVTPDPDTADYHGSGTDGVYVNVDHAPGRPGDWFFSAMIDSDSSASVETAAQDQGPYVSRLAATAAGKAFALQWCAGNGVDCRPTPPPPGYAVIALLGDEAPLADLLQGSGENRVYLYAMPPAEHLREIADAVDGCRTLPDISEWVTLSADAAANFEAENNETAEALKALAAAGFDVALIEHPESGKERTLIQGEGEPLGSLDALDCEDIPPSAGELVQAIREARRTS